MLSDPLGKTRGRGVSLTQQTPSSFTGGFPGLLGPAGAPPPQSQVHFASPPGPSGQACGLGLEAPWSRLCPSCAARSGDSVPG